MSREIKFRAFDKAPDAEVMYSPEDLKRFDSEGVLMYYDVLAGHYKYLIVMQYTGKLDESGNEIFEGDVIGIAMDRLGDSYPNFKENDYCICEVIFESGGFHAVNFDKEYQFPLWAVNKDAITRLGDRYTAPELLTKQ